MSSCFLIYTREGFDNKPAKLLFDDEIFQNSEFIMVNSVMWETSWKGRFYVNIRINLSTASLENFQSISWRWLKLNIKVEENENKWKELLEIICFLRQIQLNFFSSFFKVPTQPLDQKNLRETL